MNIAVSFSGWSKSRRRIGWAAVPALISVGASLINRNAAKGNASNTSNLQYQPIDLTSLQEQAHQTAVQNATNSLALENQLQPNVSAARGELSSQVASDLEQNGNLPTDVANQVTRSSITGANSAGLIGGGGPITAASLGLTALQLRNANQAKASSLLAANPLPVAGLDPGQIASAAIANNNAENQFNLYKSGAMNNVNQSNANANAGLLGSLGSLVGTVGKAFTSSSGSASTTGYTGD